MLLICTRALTGLHSQLVTVEHINVFCIDEQSDVVRLLLLMCSTVTAPMGAVLMNNLGPLWLKIEEKTPAAQVEESANAPPPGTPSRGLMPPPPTIPALELEMARRLYTGQVFF